MVIDRNIQRYIVFAEDSLFNALSKISAEKTKAALVVSQHGRLEGVLTDGDFRRWVVKTGGANLAARAIDVCNRSFTSARISDSREALEDRFSERVQLLPLVDEQQHLCAVALPVSPFLRIGERLVAQEQPTFVIAEIGNNHNGSVELARKLVDAAVDAGADCAKFQLRHMESLYANAGKADDAREDLGSQYVLDLLARFQLKREEMASVFDYCRQRGIIPLCTPWDVASLEFLETCGLPGYKIASADLTNPPLVEAVAATGKPLICSTGMATEQEIKSLVDLLQRAGAPYALLHCNSTYPAPFKDINLLYLDRLREIGDCVVGYSGHERGGAVAVAAVSLGARIIEKHITVDRGMEGNDHKVSLLPDEFKDMVRGIRETEAALGSAGPRSITQGEYMNREVLGKSLVALSPVARGQPIPEAAIGVRSPGKGLPPYKKSELAGRTARRDIAAGDFFYPADLATHSAEPRPFRFRRPFGIPVRYHDVKTLGAACPMDLVEFHLSYKDLDEPLEKFFDGPSKLELVVHAPELFAGDHILDLASEDEAYRRLSLDNMRRVIAVTEALKKYFPRTARPVIITNVGGSTSTGFLSAEKKKTGYRLLAESLKALDTPGVEVIIQSMPPYPWHFGGQRFHNLFVDAAETAEFCAAEKRRICLDVSHAKLAANHRGQSLTDYIGVCGKYSAHLHLADAAGQDKEGLQIGEGEVDWAAIAKALDAVAPKASFIPEVWQGHKNGGEGFWAGLARLEAHF